MLVLFRQMSKAEFQLSYDGPALRYGTMDVNELASSLLAVGDLVRESNRELNGDRANASVRVRSDFKKGSFDVALLLDYSLLEHAKNLLLPGVATVSGMGLIKILFGTEIGKKGAIGAAESVLGVWKKFKGEKPKETIEDKTKGIVIQVFGNGNRVSLGADTAMLYGKDSIRSAIAGIVRPVSVQGIKSLEIRKGSKTINEVHKSDLPNPQDMVFPSESEQSAKIRRNTRETELRVVRANFEKGKWGFSDGAASFSADIVDPVFKQQLDDREKGFYKGDTLRVILTVSQTVSSEGKTFQTTYEIERVLEHNHSPKQQSFPVDPNRLIE